MTLIGTDTIRRQRRPSFNKRKAMKALLSSGDTERAKDRLRALETRNIEMKRARDEWEAMPAWQRFCLDALGYDALSWSARKELRDLARRAKEASKMVRA